MCELFGFSSGKELVLNDYLKEFYSHSDMHPHGWGLVCLKGNEALIEKEPMQASRSAYLKKRLKAPVCGKQIFAHIRYATIGNIDYRNCHPYTRKDIKGRRWTMIHNGTIFDYSPLDKYSKLQSGDSDSERILMYVVDKVDEAIRENRSDLKAQDRFTLIEEIVSDMAKGNKLNLLMYDGEYTYVHTNYRNSLYYLNKDGKGCSALFSTQPLSKEEWKALPLNTLLVYHEGKRIYTGTDHGNEYFDNEENTKYLYQTFSNL